MCMVNSNTDLAYKHDRLTLFHWRNSRLKYKVSPTCNNRVNGLCILTSKAKFNYFRLCLVCTVKAQTVNEFQEFACKNLKIKNP